MSSEGLPNVSRSPLEITASHSALVGEMEVRRALPRAQRRTIGAWCFVDHFGPIDIPSDAGMDTPPHPHMGLQTVTWLIEGEVVHRDSLGTEQLIRPGQLNLMTAGNGITHSEEGFGRRSGRAHGVQLWVAQPERTRHGPSAFEHFASLPEVEIGTMTATVLVGDVADATSPARRDTDHFGADLRVRQGTSVVPLDPSAEHGLVMLDGSLAVNGRMLTPGHLAYLGIGSSELVVEAHEPARAVLIGGIPFEARLSMFWNFVARTHAEIDEAFRMWQAGDPRFGTVNSSLPRIPSPTPPWMTNAT